MAEALEDQGGGPTYSPELTQVREDRLAYLQAVYLDLAEHEGQATTPEAREFVKYAHSLKRCIYEIDELSPPDPEEIRLDELRAEHVTASLRQAQPLTRAKREKAEAERKDLQDRYVDGILAKITRFIDADTPEEFLKLRQLPQLVRQVNFDEPEHLTPQNLAGNHLHVLLDVALREKAMRRELIQSYQTRSLVARVAGNRAVRTTVAGSVFVLSLAPEVGAVPHGYDLLDENIHATLRTLSALMIGVDLPEIIRHRYIMARRTKKAHKLYGQLAEDQELSDLALRMAYSSSRYGGASTEEAVTGRAGTGDKEENIRRFHRLGDYLARPESLGGRSYSGHDALDYAARIMIEHKDRLAEISDHSKPAEEKRKLFLDFSRMMLVEDIDRLRQKVSDTKLHRRIMGLVAVLPAIFMESDAASLNESSTMSRDTAELIRSRAGGGDGNGRAGRTERTDRTNQTSRAGQGSNGGRPDQHRRDDERR